MRVKFSTLILLLVPLSSSDILITDYQERSRKPVKAAVTRMLVLFPTPAVSLTLQTEWTLVTALVAFELL